MTFTVTAEVRAGGSPYVSTRARNAPMRQIDWNVWTVLRTCSDWWNSGTRAAATDKTRADDA